MCDKTFKEAPKITTRQMLFVTCTEYNRCRPYREMLTYKPLTNNAAQEIELIQYLLNKLKLNVIPS
jgi:hypothetical protein